MILEHHRRACDRSGDRCGIDFDPTRVFRNAQKHGAVLKVEISSAFGKAKDGVGAEPGQGEVRKGKLSA